MRRGVTIAAIVCLIAFPALAAEPIKLDPTDFKLAGENKGTDELVKNDDGKISFYANGTATATVKVPADGNYTIIIDASCTEAQKQKAKFTLKVGNTVVKENFELTSEDEKEYKFDVKLTKGETTLSIRFTNDAYKENEYDRNLYVHAVRLEAKK
jgi:formylmethanofuran dehydrogenase subunit D